MDKQGMRGRWDQTHTAGIGRLALRRRTIALVALLSLIAASTVALYVARNAFAAETCTWTGATSSTWASASNWSCTGSTTVPGATDTAILGPISGGALSPVVDSNASLGTLQVNTGFNRFLTVNSDIVFTIGSLSAAGNISTAGNGTLTVNGAFSVTAGDFAITGNGTTNLNGNVSVSGTGTFTGTSGNVVFGGSTTATIDAPASSGALTFYNLQFNSTDGTVKTVADGDTLVVNGNLLVFTDGAVAQASVPSRGTIEFNGTTLNQATTTFDDPPSNPATVVVAGSGAQTLTGNASGTNGALPGITIRKTAGTLTLSGTFRVTRNWTYDPTSTVAIGGSGILIFGGTTSTSTVSGSHTVPNAIVQAAAGTDPGVTIASGTTLTVSGTTSIRDGKIDGPGVLRALGDINEGHSSGAAPDGGSGMLLIAGTAAQKVEAFGNGTSQLLGLLPAVEVAKPSGSLSLVGMIATGGTWTTTSGTVTPGTSTFVSHGATFVGSLTLNTLQARTGTTTISSGTLTAASLNLAGGTIATGSNTLAVTGSVTRSSGHVFGNLRRSLTTGTTSVTFDVGDATTYRPVALASMSVTSGGTLTGSVSATAGDHPQLSTAGLDGTRSVNRYWTLTGAGGLAVSSYAATFTFAAGDVDGGSTTADFRIGRYSGSSWTLESPGTRNATSTQATGIAGFGEFAIANTDTTAPTVTGASFATSAGAKNAGTPIDISIQFSEQVNVTGTPELALNTSPARSASYVSGSGTSTLTFRYTVQSGDSTSGSLDYTSTAALTGGTIADTAGNPATRTLPALGTLPASAAVTVDTSTPSVSSASFASAAGAYTTGGQIDVSVVFSEPVTVTGTPRIALNTSPARYATYQSGSGTSTIVFRYTVQAGDSTSADLDYTATSALELNGGTIGDAATNAATLTLPAVGTLPASTAITVDTAAPTVTSAAYATAAGTKKIGDTIDVTLGFSEPVAVDTTGGTPRIALNTSPARYASYVSGTGTPTLTFRYTVQSGDSTSGDLDYTSTGALETNGGTIRDAALNDATLTLPGTGTLPASAAIGVDGNTPTLSTVTATNSTTVVLTYDETLASTTPPTTAYTLTVNGGSPMSPNSVTVGTTTVTLTFAAAGTIHKGDAIALDYSNAASGVRDPAGNLAVSLSGQSVDSSSVPGIDPDTPVLVSPAAAAAIADTTPTLTATFADSDTTDTGAIHFEICATSDASCSTPLQSIDSPGSIANGANGAATAAVLGDGEYLWRARAEDETGLFSAWSATRSFTIDTTLPSVVSAATSADGTTLTLTYDKPLSTAGADEPPAGAFTVAYNGDVMGGVVFDVSISGSTVILAVSVEPNDSQAVTVAYDADFASQKIRDLPGNAAVSFTLASSPPNPVTNGTTDTTPPTVSITGGPAAGSFTSETSASFTFSVTGPGSNTIECKLDTGTFSACTSGHTIPGLSNGEHTFTVRGTDPSGNFAEASRTWTVDTVAPSAPTLSGVPADPTNQTSASIGFSGEAGGSFQCDTGSGFATCTSPVSLSGLSQGSHSFSVRQIDAAGNVGAAQTVSWTVDTTAPAAPSVSGPSSPSNDPTPTFTFSGEAGATFRCSIDSGSAASCATPFTTPTLGDGPHTLAVTQVDAAGNEGSAETFSWTIDATAPTGAAPTTPSNGSTTGPNVTLAWTSSDGADTGSLECRLDGASSFSACSQLTGLANGSHTLVVRVVDAAGNASAPSSQITWTVDAVGPVASFSAQPSNPTMATDAHFTFSFDETLSGSPQCRIDSEAFTACTSATQFDYAGPAVPLSAGSHTFELRATDQYGNVSTTTRTWTIDATGPAAPTITTTDPAEGATTSATSASFAFTGAEPGGSFQCSLDSGGFATCTSPFSTGTLSAGSHTFRVRQVDDASNAGTSATRNWTISTGSTPSGPSLASASPADGSTSGEVTAITLTASAAVDWTSVSLETPTGTQALANSSSSSATYTVTGLAFPLTTPGLYTFRAHLDDGSAESDVVSHFTIWEAASGTNPPATAKTAPAGQPGSLTTADGIASMSWPALSDGVIVNMDPAPATSSGGFVLAGKQVDVTARTIVAGTPVTSFPDPLEIVFANAPAGAIPVTSTDGGASWRAIPPLGGSTLPGGQDDGFFRSGADVHILTRHLTVFGLATTVPAGAATTLSPPQSLVGVVQPGGPLVLYWEPPASGPAANYSVWQDGQVIAMRGGTVFQHIVGEPLVADTRVFQVGAGDGSGGVSPLSERVTGVPDLGGKTLAEATQALQARGFRVGAVSQQPSSAADGSVVAQSPAVPGYLPVGSAVDVTLAQHEEAHVRLVMRAAAAPQLVLAKRKFLALRIETTMAGRLIGTLYSPRRVKLVTWNVRVRAGARVVRLKLPNAVRRTGTYDLYLKQVGDDGQTSRQALKIRIVGGKLGPTVQVPQKRIDVVLVEGFDASLDLGTKLESRFSLSHVPEADVFAAAASPGRSAGVVVLEVDGDTVAKVAELRLVFPELRVVAVAADSATAARAQRLGAAAVAVAPVSADVLARLVDAAVAAR